MRDKKWKVITDLIAAEKRIAELISDIHKGVGKRKKLITELKGRLKDLKMHLPISCKFLVFRKKDKKNGGPPIIKKGRIDDIEVNEMVSFDMLCEDELQTIPEKIAIKAEEIWRLQFEVVKEE